MQNEVHSWLTISQQLRKFHAGDTVRRAANLRLWTCKYKTFFAKPYRKIYLHNRKERAQYKLWLSTTIPSSREMASEKLNLILEIFNSNPPSKPIPTRG